jgi:hypothetical protein
MRLLKCARRQIPTSPERHVSRNIDRNHTNRSAENFRSAVARPPLFPKPPAPRTHPARSAVPHRNTSSHTSPVGATHGVHRTPAKSRTFKSYFYEYKSLAKSVSVSRGTFQPRSGRDMSIGTQTTSARADTKTTNATHVTKPPISNRQKLARLEIVATPTEQSPDPKSNRQFLRLSRPLPWIQWQHQALQLQLPGQLYRTNSAPTSEEFPIVAPAPEARHRVVRSVRPGKKCGKKPPSAGGATREAHIGASTAAPTATAPHAITTSFLITQSAIRNRRNPNKTNIGGHF